MCPYRFNRDSIFYRLSSLTTLIYAPADTRRETCVLMDNTFKCSHLCFIQNVEDALLKVVVDDMSLCPSQCL